MSKQDDRYSYDLKVGDEIAITDPKTSVTFKARVVGRIRTGDHGGI